MVDIKLNPYAAQQPPHLRLGFSQAYPWTVYIPRTAAGGAMHAFGRLDMLHTRVGGCTEEPNWPSRLVLRLLRKRTAYCSIVSMEADVYMYTCYTLLTCTNKN